MSELLPERRYRVRVRGTINDEVEVEGVANESEAREAALEAWQYVEYEDLEAGDVTELNLARPSRKRLDREGGLR